MIFKEIVLSAKSENIDDICGILYMNDVSGLVIEDERDVRDFVKAHGHLWDYIDENVLSAPSGRASVKYYFSEDEYKEAQAKIDARLKEYAAKNRTDPIGITVNTVKDEDWASSWKKYYKPIPAGEKILICPVWEDTPKTDRIVYKSNPGMVFGTGTHQSTRLCIELMEKYVKKGSHILDLGCGSGILSVVALLLGAGLALAVDIDQKAEETVFENCAINSIDESLCGVIIGNPLIDARALGGIKEKKYDVIFVNIVADIVIKYLDIIPDALNAGGVIILSGIIKDRESDVTSKLKDAGLFEDARLCEDEWIAIAGIKKI